MNRNDKEMDVMEVVGRLNELGIQATVDGRGNVVLPFASQEENGNICLPPEEMAKLAKEAFAIGLRSLPDGVLENTFITLYNLNYVYNRQ